MATATPTRTLADVYRERSAVVDGTDDLQSMLHKFVSAMVPYDTDDQRPSEQEWLDDVQTRAVDAAAEAVIAAVAAVYAGELPKLLPSASDPMAPPDLWAQGPDEIRDDAELAGAE